MQDRTCTACSITKPVTEFYFNKRFGRYFSRCRICHNSYSRKWQSENMKRKLATNARWRERNAERVQVMKVAHNMVNNAILAGKLQRGTVCSRCGSETYVEAAHADYSKPLEFNWLCRSCHRTEDSNDPKS